MDHDREVLTTVNHLIRVSNESKRNFYAAAEPMENRALKLLLKAYAQERARFVRELEQSSTQANVASTQTAPTGFFQRGWLDLKAALVVRRNRRHLLLLEELQQLETTAVEAYAQAAAAELPAALRTIVERQYERVRTIHSRVALLAKQLERRIAVRLFNQDEDVKQAIANLQQMGIPQSDLAVIPIENIAVYTNEQRARPRATREAIITGALLGMLAGGALGLLYGSFHRFYFPELDGLIATTPIGVMLEMGLHGALIGLLFSLIFSTLIATSAAETDTYLSEDSFQQGDTVVAVFADAGTIDKVERTIGLMHEHEIEPVTA